jgi:hypothetical protein
VYANIIATIVQTTKTTPSPACNTDTIPKGDEGTTFFHHSLWKTRRYTMMEYKGYFGAVEYNAVAKCIKNNTQKTNIKSY